MIPSSEHWDRLYPEQRIKKRQEKARRQCAAKLKSVRELRDGRIQVLRTDGVVMSLTADEWYDVADEVEKIEDDGE